MIWTIVIWTIGSVIVGVIAGFLLGKLIYDVQDEKPMPSVYDDEKE